MLLWRPKDLPYTGNLLAGVDEVGRGPLAGDVVAAAVILDTSKPVIRGLRDSKLLNLKQRESLYQRICDRAVCWAVGRASVEEIDRINIFHASMLAMTRAVEALLPVPEFVLVDGNRLPPWQYPSLPIVKGDDRIKAIAAASIIAKVTRDREMRELDARYPGYGFANHKGYATREHIAALDKLGPCEVHRQSFTRIREGTLPLFAEDDSLRDAADALLEDDDSLVNESAP